MQGDPVPDPEAWHLQGLCTRPTLVLTCESSQCPSQARGPGMSSKTGILTLPGGSELTSSRDFQSVTPRRAGCEDLWPHPGPWTVQGQLTKWAEGRRLRVSSGCPGTPRLAVSLALGTRTRQGHQRANRWQRAVDTVALSDAHAACPPQPLSCHPVGQCLPAVLSPGVGGFSSGLFTVLPSIPSRPRRAGAFLSRGGRRGGHGGWGFRGGGAGTGLDGDSAGEELRGACA